MASTWSNIHENSAKTQETLCRKCQKIDTVDQNTTTTTTSTNLNRWKSPSQQQTYTLKLLHALRHLRRRTTASTAAPPLRGGAVREAADEVLAVVAARGRKRWSRVILAKGMKLRLKKHKKANRVVIKSKGSSRLSGAGVGEMYGKLPAVDKRAKVLGRLVPGCRDVSFPNLLEEAIDYIGAVQMQVRAMAALAELLTAC